MKAAIKFDNYLACAYAEGFCEGENATTREQLEAWAYIAKTGLWRSLQGFYGRTLHILIEEGLITPEGKITEYGLNATEE